MNQAEKNCISNAIDNVIARETRMCNEYCKLNPTDAVRRRRDRDTIVFAAMIVGEEIKKELETCTM